MSEQENQGRSIIGRVVSNKADKTITVMVERRLAHPLYKKYMRRSSKLRAHDESNQCQEGDLVRIESCRPISRTKTWRLLEVVERPS